MKKMNLTGTESVHEYEIWSDIEIQAFLILLEECPLEMDYRAVDDMVWRKADGIVVIARFDGMVNPLGYIRGILAKDAARVITAMETNLNSRMRRHAAMYRRSCHRRNRLLQQADRKCNNAIKRLRETLGNTVLRGMNREQYEQATAPYYDEYCARARTIDHRVRHLYKAAYRGVADKHFTHYVTALMARAEGQCLIATVS